MTGEEQRELIARYIERIDVGPSARERTVDLTRVTILTKVPSDAETAALLLEGRRRYREALHGDRPFATLLRFVELWKLDKTPEELAEAYEAARVEDRRIQIEAEALS